jgi:hypothetical protein
MLQYARHSLNQLRSSPSVLNILYSLPSHLFAAGLVLAASGAVSAQCICTLNMSFERAAGSCFGQDIGPTNCIPNAIGPGETWTSCTSWGCGSTDIGPNPGGSISMGNTQPTDGNSFLSMECSGGPGGAGEGISMSLCEGISLQAGQQYCFAIDLITRNGGFGAGSSGLVIYGSNSPCQTTQTLWTLPQATGAWQTYNFCFTPTGNWTVISFRVLNPSSGFSAIGLDNWRSTDGLFPPQSPGCLNVSAQGGTACPGECTTVSATASDGAEPYTFTWSGGLPNGPGPHQVCPATTTTYTVTVTDADGITATADAVATISSQGCMSVEAAGGSICTGDCFTLFASASGGFEPYTYSWSNGVPSGPGPHEVCPSTSTTYTVVATDASGTVVNTSVTVEVSDENCISVEAEGGIICLGECFTLQATASGGTPPYTFSWSPGGFTGPGPHSACPTTSTSYTVTVTDQDGGTSSRTVVVQVIEATVSAGPDRTISCTNDPIVLVGTSDIPNGTVVWSSPNGRILQGGNSLQPTVDRPGTYTISVTDPATGCTFTDAAVVVYDGASVFDPSNVVFPNVISANGDGSNDSFFPFFSSDPDLDLDALASLYELSIYNRWGQLVFSTDKPTERWEARTDAGERVSDGVYYFIARLKIVCGGDDITERNGYIQVLN